RAGRRSDGEVPCRSCGTDADHTVAEYVEDRVGRTCGRDAEDVGRGAGRGSARINARRTVDVEGLADGQTACKRTVRSQKSVADGQHSGFQTSGFELLDVSAAKIPDLEVICTARTEGDHVRITTLDVEVDSNIGGRTQGDA